MATAGCFSEHKFIYMIWLWRCSYVDGLEKKIDSMTEELTNMQNQIKEMQEDTLVNNAKKALSEAQERLNARCEQIKSQVSEVKEQVKSTAKSIVDEVKVKGRSALYRGSEFLGIKKSSTSYSSVLNSNKSSCISCILLFKFM